ncbi:nuclear transport factor 2 family protein [Bosea sp. BK604]|uniref:nuclear transport factor 2 family protein n=1 Tax=Bosea sp. BK604 TaxID=2512180 RepID=UPI0010D6505C|nr:nuclear transport factor 2 family protein [Bosea sp. BK604]TCR65716.1 SnoaL-like protein [Bosea sp. BK604]
MSALASRDAIEGLVLGFFLDLDTGAFEDLADRMAPGGRWHRQGEILTDRQAILAAMAARGNDVRTAHLVTNFQLADVTETAATAKFYMVAFRHDGPVVAGTPSPLDLPRSIGLYECRCVLVGDAWRIEDMRADPRFRK